MEPSTLQKLADELAAGTITAKEIFHTLFSLAANNKLLPEGALNVTRDQIAQYCLLCEELCNQIKEEKK